MLAIALQQGGWGPGSHMGWAGGWYMWAFWLALLALIIVAIWFLTVGARTGGRDGSRDAKGILRDRLARGEIDEETYRRLSDALER